MTESTVDGNKQTQNMWVFRSFFSNHWVGVVGSLFSILSVFLAIYLYSQNISRPELVYYVNPVRTTVVKQGTTSRLSVSVDGRPLTQDVTAVQVAIWNRGKQAIRQDSVLEPIVIRTRSKVPILEATISRKSREAVALNVDQRQLNEGQITLSWRILEEGDGGVIQLVYAAGPDTQIECTGAIEGQKYIQELRYPGTLKSPAEQLASSKKPAFLGISFVIMAGLNGLWIFLRIAKPVERIVTSFMTVGMVIVMWYFFVRDAIPRPPFGFQ